MLVRSRGTGAKIGMHMFGASAPLKDLLTKFGFTTANIGAAAREQLMQAEKPLNPLKRLGTYGQSIWLDFLARSFVERGDLARLIEEDGLAGVTSNPSIFEKAIAHGHDYERILRELIEHRDAEPIELYEQIAAEDVCMTADVLHCVYERTAGRDGYVSLEVSPSLAHQTDATIGEARRLWAAVNRKNLMIKVPATREGLPAIRTLIGAGINVNITLLFSQDVYEQVANAYLDGVEELVRKGGNAHGIASVAGFFVSRIDTAVDNLIDGLTAEARDDATRMRLRGLKGKAAIANAKLAYQRCLHIFSGERWQRLAAQGARTQRLLWGSTGTKNPDYSDVLYVEELIGPDTVNTVPPATMDAFRDHGKPRPSLTEDVDGAKRVMSELAASGLSIDQVTKMLVEDGVQLFAQAFDDLLAAVAARRATVRELRP